ncbi:MAG: hypothetical protein AAGF06_05760 [Pseudomonadota bacterium]
MNKFFIQFVCAVSAILFSLGSMSALASTVHTSSWPDTERVGQNGGLGSFWGITDLGGGTPSADTDKTHGYGILGLTDWFACIVPFACTSSGGSNIAGEPTKATSITKFASIAGSTSAWAKINVANTASEDDEGRTDVCPGGYNAEMVMNSDGVIGDWLAFVTVTTYLDGVEVESNSNIQLASSFPVIELLIDSGASGVGFTTSPGSDFNMVGVSVASLASGINSVEFYHARCYDPAEGTETIIVGDGSQANPYVSSWAADERVGQAGGADAFWGISALGFGQPEEQTDKTHGYGLIGVTDLIGCLVPLACTANGGNNIAGAPEKATSLTKFASIAGLTGAWAKVNVPNDDTGNGQCPAGYMAEMIMNADGVIGDWLGAITVSTYLDGVLAESQSNFQLASSFPIFEALIDSGATAVGFQSTKPFNMVSVQVTSLAGGINSIEFYHARCFTAGANTDRDADGLSNDEEATLGTNPDNADTDGDGVNDAEEVGDDINNPANSSSDDEPDVIDALDPCYPSTEVEACENKDLDSDGDGLTNAQEAALGTDPDKVDTDGDGQNDKVEVGDDVANPANSSSEDAPDKIDALDPCYPSVSVAVCDRNVADADRDGLSDVQEAQLGTDPKNPDTDGDGTGDAQEVGANVAKPLNSSSLDNPDVIDAKDPCWPTVLVAACKRDSDNDGLTDYEENQAGTDPMKADSDNDGLNDQQEVGNNPLSALNRSSEDRPNVIDALDACYPTVFVAACSRDSDGDGLTDYQEQENGTDVNAADTDLDGLTDGEEVNNVDDPATESAPSATSDPKDACDPDPEQCRGLNNGNLSVYGGANASWFVLLLFGLLLGRKRKRI